MTGSVTVDHATNIAFGLVTVFLTVIGIYLGARKFASSVTAGQRDDPTHELEANMPLFNPSPHDDRADSDHVAEVVFLDQNTAIIPPATAAATAVQTEIIPAPTNNTPSDAAA